VSRGRCWFGWGAVAAGALVTDAGCSLVALVDVLSFSTTAVIGASRGIAVVPAAPGSGPGLAAERGSLVASRMRTGSTEAPWSLSPARMLSAPRVAEVVLESPNGAAIAASLVESGGLDLVIAAVCLRNLSAAARWLGESATIPGRKLDVAVVAAGERWPDGSLRPGVEDLAVAAALLGRLPAFGLELEAEASATARLAAAASDDDLAAAVRASASAAELERRGDAQDVDLAATVDADSCVPVCSARRWRFEAAQKPGNTVLS
jgi:2-phosphosulfolactate phosphatase